MYCRSRQGNDPDWERLKNTICQLYENNKLKDVMRIMETDHTFKASEKLYKTKLQSWGADNKRIKPNEYKAILKKKRKREQDIPGKATSFELNGQIVPDNKIIRWEDRMRKQGRISENDTFSEVDTPDNLTARTPSPSITSHSPKFEIPLNQPLSRNSRTPYSVHPPNTRSPQLVQPQWYELHLKLSLFLDSVKRFRPKDFPRFQSYRLPSSGESIVKPTLDVAQHESSTTPNAPPSTHVATGRSGFDSISWYPSSFNKGTDSETVNSRHSAFRERIVTLLGFLEGTAEMFEPGIAIQLISYWVRMLQTYLFDVAEVLGWLGEVGLVDKAREAEGPFLDLAETIIDLTWLSVALCE